MKKLIAALAFIAFGFGHLMAETFITITDGVLDICVPNTSSNYQTYDTSLKVLKRSPLTVYTSRYTEFNSNIMGDGVLTMYCGGERTYIGKSNGADYPDWTKFKGDVHIYPWNEVEKNAGWYGVILNHGGKRFNPEDIAASLETTNSQLINNRLYIHDGATLATPTGIRGVRIGELNTDSGSRIFGAIKKTTSSTPSASYIVVGASDTDAELAGVIRSVDDTDTPLGIIKEGEGTYRITGNDNLINGAVRVLQGAVMINNDAVAAASGKLQGGIGHNKNGVPGIYVFENAWAGGTGSVSSAIDLYGCLSPGDGGTGKLTLADYVDDSPVALRLRPSSKLYFDINSADDYDKLDVSGNLEYYNIGQDFSASESLPIVYLQPSDGNTIKAGDEFVLIRAAGTSSLGDIDWHLRVQYPKAFTWQVSENLSDGVYTLVAKVVSLDYSGQGDVEVGNDDGPGQGDEDDDGDGFDETSDPTPLRDYADKIDKHIGVAVSTWRINGFDSDNTAEIKTIGKEFNALVAENEMKWESLQPSRGNFSYNDGDRVASLASRHNMYLRGHALAWHKQMPGWISSDGGVKNNNNYTREELLEILESHINHVVKHYKGKVMEWDVVNECLSDDQSAIRTNPEAYDLRPSVWMTGIGEDYIDSAFVYVHRADPNAKLILNEYGAEFKGAAKTEALFNLAKRLKNSGIPIDGVGLQCHLDCGKVDAAKLNATIDMYASIGLTCIITELDLGIDSTSAENLEQQAADYKAITKVVANNPNCRGMIVWGFSDDQSWRSSSPLLYNNSHKPKPAYYAVHAALRCAASADGIANIFGDGATIEDIAYYDLNGRRLYCPKGIVIKLMRMSDGSYRTEKSVIK